MMNRHSKETRIKIAVSSASAAANFVLGVTKTLVGLYTGSIAVLSDGFNNLGDVVGGAGAAAGFKVSDRKPDQKYPFGLGRAEYAVTLIMSVAVMAVGAAFAYSALDRFFYHPVVTFAWTQFIIIASTVPVKAALAAVCAKTYKVFGSGLMKAQALDNVIDTFVTLFALTGLFLSRYIAFPADAAAGLVISALFVAEGFKLAKDSFMKIAGAKDERRTRGLEKACLSFDKIQKYGINLYDLGKNYAHALVAIGFKADTSEEEKIKIRTDIKTLAARHGIEVFFTEYKEELQNE